MGCSTSGYEPGMCEVADNTEEETENQRMDAEWFRFLYFLTFICLCQVFELCSFDINLKWLMKIWKYGDRNKTKLHPPG